MESFDRILFSSNPKYSFENFVCGESNQLAFDASLAIAHCNDKEMYNPLILFAEKPLGKTHLLHSIGKELLQNDQTKRLGFISGSEFTRLYIDYVLENGDNLFYGYFDSLDVLLFDDINLLDQSNKMSQKYIFTIFNRFSSLKRKRVVITAGQPVLELEKYGFADNLISYLNFGKVVKIQPPSLELRLKFLRKRSEQYGIVLPEEVSVFLANNITSDLRQLEGSIVQMISEALRRKPNISLELAKEIFKEFK